MSGKGIGKGIGMIRNRVKMHLLRGGGEGHGHGHSRWGAGTQERAPGYVLSRTPPPPGQKRKWEDWEAPYYVTAVLTFLILGIGLNAKPDTTIETWAHKKAVERLQQKEKEMQIQSETAINTAE